MPTERVILKQVAIALVLLAVAGCDREPTAPQAPAAQVSAQAADLAAEDADVYEGGGQRAAVDALLTYSAPLSRSTSVPAGTVSYAVTINYAPNIDPSSFDAVLNGSSIRGWFNPVPGSSETVAIPLGGGRNSLKFSVLGAIGGRNGTDQDSFAFVAR
jgi:hypothetical protein